LTSKLFSKQTDFDFYCFVYVLEKASVKHKPSYFITENDYNVFLVPRGNVLHNWNIKNVNLV